jgi:hypothetical protein
MNDECALSSSFRDPCGFLFYRDGILYRQINESYKRNYDALVKNGLYDELITKELLISHQEVSLSAEKSDTVYRIIRPQKIPFISYPYEWSFGQLKDAALTTLKIERIALLRGFTLKDASAYNIQFFGGKPTFIDTLSFEIYKVGEPWVAYRQFCQHFLAPLALMAFCDIRLNQLLRIYLDGIPLDLASTLLPKRTWLHLGILMHMHLHARSQAKHQHTHSVIDHRKVGQNSLSGLIDSLFSTVQHLKLRPYETEWADYYSETNYSQAGLEHKTKLIREYLESENPRSVWDLGANVGFFSRLASKHGIFTIAFDIDPACVERNYLDIIENQESLLLPLVLDLTNPSPAIGWENKERTSLVDRGPADMVFMLALIHHLSISNNLSFDRISRFLARICSYLVIEYIPKEDSQVQKMLANREDIFDEYAQDIFEREFSKRFLIVRKDPIIGSLRTLYLMKRGAEHESQ